MCSASGVSHFGESVLMVHLEPWLKSRVPDSAFSNVEGRRSVRASKTSVVEKGHS